MPHNLVRRRSLFCWVAWLAPMLAGSLVWRHGLSVPGLLYACFALLLLALSIIDIETLRLPDVLTLPGAGLALTASFCLDLPFVESLAGAVLGGATFWLFAWKFPQNLGLGDAKLMLLLGALCGLRGLPVVILVGSALGLLVAMAMQRKHVPFGPFLSVGAFLHMLGVRV